MHNPVRVLGPDITYEGLHYYFFIEASQVVAAYPSYAVKDKDGQLWVCTPDHEEAILIMYKLKYSDGNIYTCGNEKELNKLGLSLTPETEKRSIGFILDEQGKKHPGDLSN